MSRLVILTICSLILALIIFFKKKDKARTVAAGKGLVIKKEWLKINPTPITPKEEIRPADQTFLTFPEWYLVFSPEEQAEYFKTRTSTSFPYASHIRQLWDSYKIVKDQIKGNFPTNTGYHFMIWVIATSTTVEYGAKSIYETLIGRLTDTQDVITEEDKFNAAFAKRYVDFIKDRPWYEFNFKNEMKVLWGNVPFFGKRFVRKFERRYALTTELLVKYVYGKLIGLGTQTVYDVALPTTAVVVDKLPKDSLKENIIKESVEGGVIVKLPRYDKFSTAALTLAKQGISFKEIAGNNSAILITFLTPAEKSIEYRNVQVVFTQPISSNMAVKRIAIALPVAQLSSLLLQLEKDQIQVEHIFDF
ncbi:hypothetical protein WSM22_15740 [Cytophagales bacterium WSM2-2]|nr:hypothetical protein WSM22_15740 [Cytophagales bacterium WSM2-2]